MALKKAVKGRLGKAFSSLTTTGPELTFLSATTDENDWTGTDLLGVSTPEATTTTSKQNQCVDFLQNQKKLAVWHRGQNLEYSQ